MKTNDEMVAEFRAIRTKAISEMFDSVDKYGIYPTTIFFNVLDSAFKEVLGQKDQEKREIIESVWCNGCGSHGCDDKIADCLDDWKEEQLKKLDQ